LLKTEIERKRVVVVSHPYTSSWRYCFFSLLITHYFYPVILKYINAKTPKRKIRKGGEKLPYVRTNSGSLKLFNEKLKIFETNENGHKSYEVQHK
jgi:hypothetical protein